MSMKFSKITGRNKFCGPAAIAAVLNTTSDEGARLIREANNITAVKGLYVKNLTKALDSVNVQHTVKRFSKPNRPTVSQWLASSYHGQTVILFVTGHFITLSGDSWIDNNTKKPQPLSTISKRTRVQGVIAIQCIPEYTAPVKVAKPAFTGDKTSLDDIVRHYGTRDVVDYYDDRIESMQAEEYINLQRAQQLALDDLFELAHVDGADLVSCKTIRLIAHKWGAL